MLNLNTNPAQISLFAVFDPSTICYCESWRVTLMVMMIFLGLMIGDGLVGGDIIHTSREGNYQPRRHNGRNVSSRSPHDVNLPVTPSFITPPSFV